MAAPRGTPCPHASEDPPAAPRADRCEGCGSGFNLRVCLTCGHVGCCESQRGHNTLHHAATGHPRIRPLPLGPRGWTWCYACKGYVEAP